jgi:hypothetical protein
MSLKSNHELLLQNFIQMLEYQNQLGTPRAHVIAMFYDAWSITEKKPLIPIKGDQNAQSEPPTAG